MSYIGVKPTIGNFQICDAISVVNNQAAYTMQVGSVNVSPESANHMIVSLNGVIQKPTDAFTVSGSTITFASNLVTGDVINFIQILGNVLDLGVPSDSTVSLAKLTATGTKDATTFLRGDNTFAAAGGGKVLQIVQAQTNTAKSMGGQSYVDTNLTGAITPSASNSKVLVLVNQAGNVNIGSNAGQKFAMFNLVRGSTEVTAISQRYYRSTISTAGDYGIFNGIVYLDSPNTTNATTYKTQMKITAAGSMDLMVQQNSGYSTITLIEIGA